MVSAQGENLQSRHPRQRDDAVDAVGRESQALAVLESVQGGIHFHDRRLLAVELHILRLLSWDVVGDLPVLESLGAGGHGRAVDMP